MRGNWDFKTNKSGISTNHTIYHVSMSHIVYFEIPYIYIYIYVSFIYVIPSQCDGLRDFDTGIPAWNPKL